jgi:hypothetical protein
MLVNFIVRIPPKIVKNFSFNKNMCLITKKVLPTLQMKAKYFALIIVIPSVAFHPENEKVCWVIFL